MRASRSGREGRRKNFPVEGEDNHLRSVCRPDPPSLAAWPGLLFGAKKAKKSGEIQFDFSLPPPLFFLRFAFYLWLSLPSFPSFMAKFVFQLSESLQSGRGGGGCCI